MVIVIWHKAAWPLHTDGSIVFARWRQCAPPWPTWFSVPNCISIGTAVFCTAHSRISLYFTTAAIFSLTVAPLRGATVRDRPSKTRFLVPTRVHIPNGISIGSAVFAGLTVVTDSIYVVLRCSLIIITSGQSNFDKATSPPQWDGSVVFARCSQCQHMLPWAHLSPYPKWHLDRFSSFCRDHDRDRETGGQTDHATPSVTVGLIYVRSTAMRYNDDNMQHLPRRVSAVKKSNSRRNIAVNVLCYLSASMNLLLLSEYRIVSGSHWISRRCNFGQFWDNEIIIWSMWTRVLMRRNQPFAVPHTSTLLYYKRSHEYCNSYRNSSSEWTNL